jgi:hypothetical protein
MHIGVLTLHLSVDGADSLKDKRQSVKSLIAHLRQKFNVSVSEVDNLDTWRRATLGVAFVSNDTRFANQVLSKVVNHVEHDLRVVLDDYHLEFVDAGGGGTPRANEDEIDVSDWFV